MPRRPPTSPAPDSSPHRSPPEPPTLLHKTTTPNPAGGSTTSEPSQILSSPPPSRASYLSPVGSHALPRFTSAAHSRYHITRAPAPARFDQTPWGSRWWRSCPRLFLRLCLRQRGRTGWIFTRSAATTSAPGTPPACPAASRPPLTARYGSRQSECPASPALCLRNAIGGP